MHDPIIGDLALETFRRDGVLILKRFYDPARDVAPIKEGIRRIVALLARKYGVDAPCATPDEAMTRGYLALIRVNRAWGGEVYDAIKQIPAFARLVSAPDNERLFAQLRPGSVPGLAAGGHGIRIDNPGEARFRAPWHQEFPAQLRSLDGVVFWSPLLLMTPDMGPVEMAAGSHLEGVVPVWKESLWAARRRLCPAAGPRGRAARAPSSHRAAHRTGRSGADGFPAAASVGRKPLGPPTLEHAISLVQLRRADGHPRRLARLLRRRSGFRHSAAGTRRLRGPASRGRRIVTAAAHHTHSRECVR
jgi:hypothetical protein